MANSFATELREGYCRVATCLSEEERCRVARARDPIHTSPVERNRILAEIVCAYRMGRRPVWGPVILDLLAPSLVLVLQGLRAQPPTIDDEEIRQQLVLEVLKAADRIPLHPGGRQTRFRITSRAYTAMLRWLAREGRRQGRQVELDSAGEGSR
jgi:hypothetical protein